MINLNLEIHLDYESIMNLIIFIMFMIRGAVSPHRVPEGLKKFMNL